MLSTKIYKLSTVFLIVISFFLQTPISSQYKETIFDKNNVFSDQVFYSVPDRFNTQQKIQDYLVSQKSVLANYKVEVSFADGDRNLNNSIAFPDVEDVMFTPSYALKDYLGKKILFSEFLWLLTRTGFGSSCGPTGFDGKNLNKFCYNNIEKPINPAFVLALIQKESRLVYGVCARSDADTNPECSYSKPNSVQKLQFRLDRAVGYYCFETSDKTKSCWDENTSWKFYKGVFRQVYFALRLLRVREQTCHNSKYAFENYRGKHLVGGTFDFGGQKVTFMNGLTCSLYIYTPHVADKDLFWRVMRDLKGFDNFREGLDLPNDYNPDDYKKTELF
jgi:hypothetical protein